MTQSSTFLSTAVIRNIWALLRRGDDISANADERYDNLRESQAEGEKVVMQPRPALQIEVFVELNSGVGKTKLKT